MINKLIEKYKKELEELETMKTGYVAYYGERTKCKEFIQDLEELKPTTINGYSIEEVITILNALDLERILDIKMTMGNLSILAEKLQEDFNENLKKSFELATKQFRD